MGILENIISVKRRIAEAARRAGRVPGRVELVAVTKYAEDGAVMAALETGELRWIAESRVQDAHRKSLSLREMMSRNGVGMRMIGHLQSNKAAKAVLTFEALDSLDSLKTAQSLERHLEQREKILPALVQLNLGNASQRGILPAQLGDFIKRLADFKRLRIQGLMAIGPHSSDLSKIREAFRQAGILFERFFKQDGKLNAPKESPVLSLGMSSDFELAVEEGATQVRVGSAIFESET